MSVSKSTAQNAGMTVLAGLTAMQVRVSVEDLGCAENGGTWAAWYGNASRLLLAIDAYVDAKPARRFPGSVAIASVRRKVAALAAQEQADAIKAAHESAAQDTADYEAAVAAREAREASEQAARITEEAATVDVYRSGALTAILWADGTLMLCRPERKPTTAKFDTAEGAHAVLRAGWRHEGRQAAADVL